MTLRYVLDEQLRGQLWSALQHHNAAGQDVVDVTRVGDPLGLPIGTPDPDLLLWAEREGRIVVSADKKTMPTHLANHLRAGHHCPGLMLIRSGSSLPSIVFALALAAHAGDPSAYEGQANYIP
jgi:hypothetical protein